MNANPAPQIKDEAPIYNGIDLAAFVVRVIKASGRSRTEVQRLTLLPAGLAKKAVDRTFDGNPRADDIMRILRGLGWRLDLRLVRMK